ncbi:23S rRNA (adenine(2503)-C(2))-methyltransferase RlmN [Patescibacteria group bacterium]|nr:23S rRNA (adenine(2503)-C(2))-methyltransferase RlmN [Patescibacteria group bacterium]
MSFTSKTKRDYNINRLAADMPDYRLKQIQTALFDYSVSSWNEVTTLPKTMRELFNGNIPWISLQSIVVSESENGDSKKALLRTQDDLSIESVLMRNKRGHWTVCISSQVGCAMKCAFCATGAMGLTRNLTSDEIIDQLRFWIKDIGKDERITNIVFMGMGEPLANYAEVREALNIILDNTEIGPTRITISTVGVMPRLWKTIEDPMWPPVRIAISLHSVNQNIRHDIMPSTAPDFLDDLQKWSLAYLEKFGNRRRHITFEYLLLKGVNDTDDDAKALAKYAKSIGKVKINLIAYNQTKGFDAPTQQSILNFQDILLQNGIDATRRKSLGASITAACGQLATKQKSQGIDL